MTKPKPNIPVEIERPDGSTLMISTSALDEYLGRGFTLAGDGGGESEDDKADAKKAAAAKKRKETAPRKRAAAQQNG